MPDARAGAPPLMRPPKIENPRFLKSLVSKNIISADFVQDLLDEFDGNALDVLSTLVQSGVGGKRELCQLWCDSIGIAHADLEKTLFQPHVVRRIPERIARLYYAIPIYQMGEAITVATATPDNPEIAKTIEKIVGRPVSLVFALPQEIESAIEKAYQTSTALYEFFNKIAASQFFKKSIPVTSDELTAVAGEEAINQLHVALILFGVTEKASEIRIVPESEHVSIAFVIDEVVGKRIRMAKSIYGQMLLKLKAMARVDLVVSGRPLYGRILFPTPGKKIDIRFESQPTDNGETVTLGLMHPKPLKKIYNLDQLYIAHRILGQIDDRLQERKGLILFAGPPGSGKSTLAYAALNRLKRKGKRIITIEQEVKHLLTGIDQYQINPKAKFPPAEALASCLKQRPEVLFIQDIEEPSIINRASTAALSSQLVLAGIRAPNTFYALDTAIKLGIGEAITVIITQQLVPRLCDHCKQRYRLSAKQVDTLFVTDGHPDVFAWQAKGCAYCRHSGFSGRIGVHELLMINGRIRKLIIRRAPIADIHKATGPDNFISMHYDGIKKVLRGLTTFNKIETLPSS